MGVIVREEHFRAKPAPVKDSKANNQSNYVPNFLILTSAHYKSTINSPPDTTSSTFPNHMSRRPIVSPLSPLIPVQNKSQQIQFSPALCRWVLKSEPFVPHTHTQFMTWVTPWDGIWGAWSGPQAQPQRSHWATTPAKNGPGWGELATMTTRKQGWSDDVAGFICIHSRGPKTLDIML